MDRTDSPRGSHPPANPSEMIPCAKNLFRRSKLHREQFYVLGPV